MDEIKELKLSVGMIETLENVPLHAPLPRGGTRAALIRRGLVEGGDSHRFGRFTEAGLELAQKLRRQL